MKGNSLLIALSVAIVIFAVVTFFILKSACYLDKNNLAIDTFNFKLIKISNNNIY